MPVTDKLSKRTLKMLDKSRLKWYKQLLEKKSELQGLLNSSSFVIPGIEGEFNVSALGSYVIKGMIGSSEILNSMQISPDSFTTILGYAYKGYETAFNTPYTYLTMIDGEIVKPKNTLIPSKLLDFAPSLPQMEEAIYGFSFWETLHGASSFDDDCKLLSLLLSAYDSNAYQRRLFSFNVLAIDGILCRAWFQNCGVIDFGMPKVEVNGVEYADVLSYIQSEFELKDEHMPIMKKYLGDIVEYSSQAYSFYTNGDAILEILKDKSSQIKMSEHELGLDWSQIFSPDYMAPEDNITDMIFMRENLELTDEYYEELRLKSAFINSWHFLDPSFFTTQIYLDVCDEKLEVSSVARVWIERSMYGLYISSIETTLKMLLGILIDNYRKVDSQSSEYFRKLEKMTEDYEKMNAKAKEFKKNLKESKKKAEESKRKYLKVEKQLAELMDRPTEGVSHEEHSLLVDELSKKLEAIDRLSTQNGELSRKCTKQEKEIELLEAKVDEISRESEHNFKLYQSQREYNDGVDTMKAAGDIPIDCFVEAIRKYKITLIGGDTFHSKISESGLDNIKMFKAGSRGVKNYDIIGKQLVVIATDYIDHATIDNVNTIAGQNGVKLLYYNNRNFERFVYECFKAIFG